MVAELTARPDRQHAARRARAALARRASRSTRSSRAQNPTGSIKDRVALAMVDAAGLEPGAGAARADERQHRASRSRSSRSCAGYKLTCVMPANATPERRLVLELYGATIVDSPAAEGSNGAVRLAQELAAADPRYTMLFQYANEANPRAHYEGTGAEIVRDLPRVDALVAGLGTGGTLMGTGARLREAFPDVVVAAAEPLPGDPVMGLRSLEDGYVPADPRRLEARPEDPRLERRVGRGGARPARAGGDLRRRLRRARSSTSRGGSPTSSRRARPSSPCSPTAAGSTCRRDFWRSRGRRAVDGEHALVVVPERDPRRAARPRRRGGAERVLRRHRLPRRGRRALPPRAATGSPRPTATSSRSTRRSGSSRTRATSSRSSTRTRRPSRGPRAPTASSPASGRASRS